MTIDHHRTASVIVATGAATAMLAAEGMTSAVALAVATGCPLLLIWFAEPLGAFVGRIGLRNIQRESPPGLVRAFGWIFLAVLVAAALIRLTRAVG